MTQISDTPLLAQLQKIGLHHTDAQIYLASVRIGAGSIKQLTNYTGLNRVTVHDAVARLIDKGLMLETYSGKRRMVFAQQISQLQHLVDTKKSELDDLQLDVTKTIHLLQSLHLQSEHLPQIRISKGREGIMQMLRDIRDSGAKNIYIVTDSRHFDELLSVQFLETLANTKISTQIVLPAGFEHFLFSASAKGLSVESYILDAASAWTGGMTIYANKVALHAYEGVFITTTLIENAPIAKMMLASFAAMKK